MLLTILRYTARGKTTKYINEILSELENNKVTIKKMNQEIRCFSKEAPQQIEDQETTLLQSSKTKKLQQQLLRRDKQQQAARKKTIPYVPGTVSLQVLGAGANGAPSAVYLFTDQSRYLFNCGEGTQRLAHEHKTKLSRLEQIFVTRNTWTTIGGFPGLALTVQDAGVKELSLHGPPHLDSILHSMKRFVVLKALQIKTLDCTQIHDFEDQVMTVKCIPLYKTETITEKSISNDNENAEENVVIAYICKLKPRAGTLNLEKCVERGVPPGPLLGLLKNGMDVTLDNGIVIKSKDVSEPGETALSFIFLDIPSEEYLPALQANAKLFHNDTQVKSDENSVALIVHFSPKDIINNNCYKDFMQTFSPQPQHVYLNKSQNSFSGYIAAHRIQYQLNQLNENIFPLLGESEHVCNSLSNKLKKTKLGDEKHEITGKSIRNQNNEEVECVQSLTNYHMRPRKGFDHTQEAKLNPSEYLQETQVLKDFPSCLEKLKESMLLQRTPTRTFPKIIFLGTGSCIPNKTRNVSAILLQPTESSYLLLDCGEGTLGQITRFFGKTKAEQVVRQLHAIYVSHLHADHHIGLIGIFNERQRLLGAEHEKLLLFAPKQIQSWLDFYNERIERIDTTYKLIGNAEMLQEPYVTLSSAAGVREISTCLVRHCPHSFGVSLSLKAEHNGEPIKITYSGDSMPCQDLVDLGQNTTILIHEATMEDDLIEEAKIKMHSTISQAIAQGHEMQAKHIILTHFSQRYAKLPRMQQLGGEEAEAETLKNVAIAFDNMCVSLEDLENFHILYPALKALFAEHAEELEQKALKRELKLERKRKLLNVD